MRERHVGGGELLATLRTGGMSGAQLRDEVITIMMSGTETTAITLCWAFQELAGRPDIARRLHAEIDDAIGTRPASLADVDRLPYTGRYLNEIMRLHAVPVIMRKTIAPLDLAGHRFPEGAEVCYSPYGLHRDPRLFAEPLRLDPDRWAAGAPRPAKGGVHPVRRGPPDVHRPYLRLGRAGRRAGHHRLSMALGTGGTATPGDDLGLHSPTGCTTDEAHKPTSE